MTFSERFLEALHYEQWLRFYFLEDAPASEAGETAAAITVPEAAAARSRREEPQLSGILEGLRGREVSMERSRSVIFHYLAAAADMAHDGTELTQAVAKLAEDADFRRSIDLFQSWVQELADGETSVNVPPAETGDTLERAPAGDLETVRAVRGTEAAEHAPGTEPAGGAKTALLGTEAALGAGAERQPVEENADIPSFRAWETAFRVWAERQRRQGN